MDFHFENNTIKIIHQNKTFHLHPIWLRERLPGEKYFDLDTNQIPYKEWDLAWFFAFGPYKKPRYAISVLVEHGGSGSKSAAPIAKKVIKATIFTSLFKFFLEFANVV